MRKSETIEVYFRSIMWVHRRKSGTLLVNTPRLIVALALFQGGSLDPLSLFATQYCICMDVLMFLEMISNKYRGVRIGLECFVVVASTIYCILWGKFWLSSFSILILQTCVALLYTYDVLESWKRREVAIS